VVGTLIGIAIGGLLAISVHALVVLLRTRSARRALRREFLNAARSRQGLFYSSQRLIRDSIESGKWWPDERATLGLPGRQELRQLSGHLPYDVWEIYMAAACSLSLCANYRRRAGESPAPIEPPLIQQLVGTFVTLDAAWQAFEPITRVRFSDLTLDCSSLSSIDIEQGLRAHAPPQIDQDKWRRALVPGCVGSRIPPRP
jgi:hypothetical protein